MDKRYCAFNTRALVLWPGIDRRALARCGCDPRRIANLIQRRTTLPREAILSLLTDSPVSDLEVSLWFG